MSAWGELTWVEVTAEIERQGRDAFVASVSPRGEPHLAIVWLVLVHGVVHFVSDRSAVKASNLAANPAVAAHWQVVDEGRNQLFLRGTAALVEDPVERQRLWDSGAWGDLGQWYGGAADPRLAFISIDAIWASVTEAAGSGPRRRWRAG
jgi:general stress protein 26